MGRLAADLCLGSWAGQVNLEEGSDPQAAELMSALSAYLWPGACLAQVRTGQALVPCGLSSRCLSETDLIIWVCLSQLVLQERDFTPKAFIDADTNKN